MNRITPEDVKAAYEKTGLKPIIKRWYNAKENCGCAFSAMVKAKTDRDLTEMLKLHHWNRVSFVSRLLDLDKDYVDGFINGFDNRSPLTVGNYDVPKGECFQIGCKDGRIAAMVLGL